VQFKEHNLTADPMEAGFDLIVCRNVVIYFTDGAKADLYRRFHAALRPGGVLFVGGTEVISRPGEIGFHPFGISFYQRMAGGR
jgi:chemotaxis protein methyltransferase CheR